VTHRGPFQPRPFCDSVICPYIARGDIHLTDVRVSRLHRCGRRTPRRARAHRTGTARAARAYLPRPSAHARHALAGGPRSACSRRARPHTSTGKCCDGGTPGRVQGRTPSAHATYTRLSLPYQRDRHLPARFDPVHIRTSEPADNPRDANPT